MDEKDLEKMSKNIDEDEDKVSIAITEDKLKKFNEIYGNEER
jgi:hypothetical protein